MAADGSWHAPGGAPDPDPARVAALADGLTPAADFAEIARQGAADCLARLASEAKARGHEDCAGLIADVRAGLDRLAPQGLTPRRGLAGLFDGRGKALKRFRAAFSEGCAALGGPLSTLGERMTAVDGRHAALDALTAELRAAISDLSAHVAAGRTWLAKQTDQEAAADFRARIDDLAAAVAAAVRALPLARALQNADACLRDGIDGVSKGVDAWRDDWRAHLGLDRKRPRRVKPSPQDLIPARDRLTAALGRAEREMTAAAARRAEIAGRLPA